LAYYTYTVGLKKKKKEFHSKCPGPCRRELTTYYLGIGEFASIPIERRVARVEDAIPYDADVEAAAAAEAREIVERLSRQ
jgi:hypothetical protein